MRKKNLLNRIRDWIEEIEPINDYSTYIAYRLIFLIPGLILLLIVIFIGAC